jgi:hypothetical protein
MTKLIAIKLLLVSLFMMNFAVETQAQTAERINFKRGTYSTTFRGSVAKNQEKRYVLGLKRNQKLKVQFTRKMQYVYISIQDGNGKALANDDNGNAEINTTDSGDYYIVISTKYGQAENFSLRVTAR